MNDNESFRIKYNVSNLLIHESEFWVWSLRPHQATIGAGILSLKRDCKKLSETNVDEYCDLQSMICVVEKTLKKVMDYDVINYLILMMFDRQLHFHVLPRYEKPVFIIGENWVDKTWPIIPNLLGDPLSESKEKELLELLKYSLVFR